MIAWDEDDPIFRIQFNSHPIPRRHRRTITLAFVLQKPDDPEHESYIRSIYLTADGRLFVDWSAGPVVEAGVPRAIRKPEASAAE